MASRKPRADAKPGRKKAPKKPTKKAQRGKYDRKICARIESLGELGKSPVQIRRDLGIPRSTWGLWIQTHPEFAAAVSNADDAAQAYWQDLGHQGVLLGSVRFNATAYIFQMKNRWPGIYRDRQDHQFTGADGGPIVQELRAPDLRSITDAREAVKEFDLFRASLARPSERPH